MSTKEIEKSLKFIRDSKRANDRFPFDGTVGIKVGSEYIKGTCLNISLGGLFATFTGSARTGELLSVSLDLPGVVDKILKAQVVWVIPKENNQVGIGLKFLSINDQVMKAIVTLSANIELRDM